MKQKEITKEEIKKAKDNLYLEPTMSLDDWPEVKGYDFDKPFEFSKFVDSLFNTGFQATQLNAAIQIFNEMQKEDTTIFLGYTSNMVSCGVREIIKYLTKNKKVHVLVTTAGGVEEDIIKLLKPFVIGSYNTPGGYLRDKGINRTGNIFIPNDRYVYFERFMNKFFSRLYDLQKTGKIITSKNFCFELGRELEIQDIKNKEESIYYWAYKNNIPVFCPGLTDGSIGDLIFFFKMSHKDFIIDITNDIVDITREVLDSQKTTGIIALGGSLPKHHIANANMFREGCDYAIYMTTAQEYEGSNAGANIEEAKSWGKIKDSAKTVKVIGDCSITFPLLIAGSLNSKKD